jgi:hypothetical protein
VRVRKSEVRLSHESPISAPLRIFLGCILAVAGFVPRCDSDTGRFARAGQRLSAFILRYRLTPYRSDVDALFKAKVLVDP